MYGNLISFLQSTIQFINFALDKLLNVSCVGITAFQFALCKFLHARCTYSVVAPAPLCATISTVHFATCIRCRFETTTYVYNAFPPTLDRAIKVHSGSTDISSVAHYVVYYGANVNILAIINTLRNLCYKNKHKS